MCEGKAESSTLLSVIQEGILWGGAYYAVKKSIEVWDQCIYILHLGNLGNQ